jgi:hypothetical protein
VKRIYVVAGEMSGDAHAAGLLTELKTFHPDLEISGAGGPEMHALSGGKINNWVEDAAVMGVIEVLKRYSWFKARFHEMLNQAIELKPDVLPRLQSALRKSPTRSPTQHPPSLLHQPTSLGMEQKTHPENGRSAR